MFGHRNLRNFFLPFVLKVVIGMYNDEKSSILPSHYPGLTTQGSQTMNFSNTHPLHSQPSSLKSNPRLSPTRLDTTPSSHPRPARQKHSAAKPFSPYSKPPLPRLYPVPSFQLDSSSIGTSQNPTNTRVRQFPFLPMPVNISCFK